MAFLEDRIGFDAAVFWSNYTDYVTNGFVADGAGLTYYSNVGTARIKGVEANLTWRPSSQWRFEARGDYLDGEFTEIHATQTAYVVGDPIDLIPRYQFTLAGQHDFSWVGKPGFIRLDYSQQAPMSYRNRSIGPWFHYESDTIQLLNFHASLQLNDNLGLGFVAQNLLNDQGFTSPYYFAQQGVRSRPRTFGVEFSATFD